MAQRPFSAKHRSRETLRTIRDGSKAIWQKGLVMRHHRGTWLVSKRSSGEYIMEQDMACWKVVARVSKNTVLGLLEGLLEGRTMVIMAQSPFWAMVGRAGIAQALRTTSGHLGQNVRNHGHHGQQGLPSPWAKRVSRACDQWQEGHFGHKGMVTWVGSFIWRWQWHGQQVLGKFNWASLI